jgi:hypothetical protein
MYKGDWILLVEFIPRRAITRETLYGVPIRFFILKIIFRILVDLRGVRDQAASAWVRRLEFLKFPYLLMMFFGSTGGRTSLLLRSHLHPSICKPRFI